MEKSKQPFPGGAGQCFQIGCITGKWPRLFLDLGDVWFPHERKERAMRAAGVAEDFVTGSTSRYEKCLAFLGALPQLAGTTLYEDAAADLAVMGCGLSPTAENAPAIWRHTADWLFSHPVAGYFEEKGAALLVEYPPNGMDFHGFSTDAAPLLDLSCLSALLPADIKQAAVQMEAATDIKVTSLATLEQALHRLLDKAAAAECRTVIFDLSGFSRFLRPDPYHADLALKTALDGKAPAAEAQLLYGAQIMRLLHAALGKRRMHLLLRFCGESHTVSGHFSVNALQSLFAYLADAGLLAPTCLSLAPDDITPAMASLLGAHGAPDGAPRLFLGLAPEGATEQDLERALRALLRMGGLPLLLGVTQGACGFLVDSGKARFHAALDRVLGESAASTDAVHTALVTRQKQFFQINK